MNHDPHSTLRRALATMLDLPPDHPEVVDITGWVEMALPRLQQVWAVRDFYGYVQLTFVSGDLDMVPIKDEGPKIPKAARRLSKRAS